MSKITSHEFANPYARVRKEHEDVIVAARSAYQTERDCAEADYEKIQKDWEKLRGAWRKKRISEKDFVEKGRALEARVKANNDRRTLVARHQDELIAALTRQTDSYVAEMDSSFDKMRGLCAYLVGSHKDTPAIRYLHGELTAYKNSTDRQEKRGLAQSISSILNSATEFKDNSEVPSILSDYDRIEDAEAKSRFYHQHRAEIHAAFNQQQGRNIDENSNPNP